MKKREKLLGKKALAMGLSGALLGSVGYVLPAAAATITVENTDQYNALGVDAKDISGHVVPVGSYTNNMVTIGTVGGGENSPVIGTDTGTNDVYGAYTVGNDSISHNTLLIHSGKMNCVYGGASEDDGTANANTVIVSGEAVITYVTGGLSSYGTAMNNHVTINGNATIDRGVCGGDGVSAINNHVNISDGTFVKSRCDVYGGYSTDGAAASNSVTVSGGTFNGGAMSIICGGYSTSGAATDNRVTISDVAIKRAWGGFSKEGAVANNSVFIRNSAATMVRGGSSSDGDVTNNSANISSSTISSTVYGGYSNNGAAIANSVFISDGTLVPNGKIYGGSSSKNTAAYNYVSIGGGTFGGEEIKNYGIAGSDIYGGYSDSDGAAANNQVMISGSTLHKTVSTTFGDERFDDGHVYGGKSMYGRAANNTVIISDCIIGGNVYGGCSEWIESEDTGELSGNKVLISGGTFGDNAYGGSVYGAYSGGIESDGVVTDNQVIISGGTFSGNIYAAYAGYMDNGNMKDNSITISRNPTFGETTVLYGGFIESGSNNSIGGNTLNIQTNDITVKNVAAFDAYNFYLINTEPDSTILKLTGGGTDSTDIAGRQVKVTGIAGTAAALQEGAAVTLMQNSNGLAADAGSTGQARQGISLIYDYTTELNDNKLQIRFSNGRTSEASKSPVETQVAAAAFLNGGADLLVSQGIDSAVAAAGEGQADIFGAMGGSNMRYKSGSYADVHGFNMALGVGKAVANNSGKLTFGSFVEYGRGSYSSHLDNGVRGDGTTRYCGVGVLVRQDNDSGVYYEGSLRYGRMDADYASNDMGAAGIRSCYETSSAYYGAHLALGKITKLNDKTYADIYTKLMYNHQNGDSVALSGEGLGEVYDFDSVDSTRVRAGIRLSREYKAGNTAYAGVAYEHEFDSEARASVKGFSTSSPSIKGSSGMFEAGYIWQPKGANDPAVDIGLQGWGGKKQGLTANVNFVWKF